MPEIPMHTSLLKQPSDELWTKNKPFKGNNNSFIKIVDTSQVSSNKSLAGRVDKIIARSKNRHKKRPNLIGIAALFIRFHTGMQQECRVYAQIVNVLMVWQMSLRSAHESYPISRCLLCRGARILPWWNNSSRKEIIIGFWRKCIRRKMTQTRIYAPISLFAYQTHSNLLTINSWYCQRGAWSRWLLGDASWVKVRARRCWGCTYSCIMSSSLTTGSNSDEWDNPREQREGGQLNTC